MNTKLIKLNYNKMNIILIKPNYIKNEYNINKTNTTLKLNIISMKLISKS